MRSFGVRRLAAAFFLATLLAGISTEGAIPSQQAGRYQSGSKLPHSKASHACTSFGWWQPEKQIAPLPGHRLASVLRVSYTRFSGILFSKAVQGKTEYNSEGGASCFCDLCMSVS
jgi:hypothetical protein